MGEGGSTSSKPTDDPFWAPFLQWVYTSEAPAQLLDLFMELVEGPGLNGTLAQAVDEAVGGNDTLRVLCTGEGAGGQKA